MRLVGRNLPRWHTVKTYRQKSGHLYCVLTMQRKSRTLCVHRLVLEAFVGPCPDGMECCHNNGDPADNRLENLRWDTISSNRADRIKHGTAVMGENHPAAKLRDVDVREIRRLVREGRRCREIAQAFGVSEGTIQQIASRRIWKYVTD